MRISDWSSDVCSSDLILSLARPAERTIARQEALEHERDQIGHGFAHPVDSLISVGIVVEHLFEIGKHADRQLDRRSVWQFGKLEFSHVSGSPVARTPNPYAPPVAPACRAGS